MLTLYIVLFIGQ